MSTLMLTALQSPTSTEATMSYKNQHLHRNALPGKENNFPEKAQSDKEMQPEKYIWYKNRPLTREINATSLTWVA